MKLDQTQVKPFCLWRFFHFRGPWHFAYYRPEVDPPATNPPPRRYKNWRALCGTQFTLNPAEERHGPPPEGGPVCQRCLRALAANSPNSTVSLRELGLISV